MRIDIKFCPHCKKHIDTKFNDPEFLEIGMSGYYQCPRCGGNISLKLKEWESFDFIDKIAYLGRYAFAMLIILPIFSVAITAVILHFTKNDTVSKAVGLGFFIICFLNGVRIIWRDIINSKMRTTLKKS